MLVRLSIASLVCGLLVAAACNLSPHDIPHKPDAELIANFQSRKDNFYKLLEMIKADKKLMRVDADWTAPEDPKTAGVSDERVQEYRRIFRESQIPRGFYAFHDPDLLVVLVASAQGLGVSGSSKGYQWRNEPCKNMTDDTDAYFDSLRKNPPPEQKDVFLVYRHIEGNWYLYYDWD